MILLLVDCQKNGLWLKPWKVCWSPPDIAILPRKNLKCNSMLTSQWTVGTFCKIAKHHITQKIPLKLTSSRLSKYLTVLVKFPLWHKGLFENKCSNFLIINVVIEIMGLSRLHTCSLQHSYMYIVKTQIQPTTQLNWIRG